MTKAGAFRFKSFEEQFEGYLAHARWRFDSRWTLKDLAKVDEAMQVALSAVLSNPEEDRSIGNMRIAMNGFNAAADRMISAGVEPTQGDQTLTDVKADELRGRWEDQE